MVQPDPFYSFSTALGLYAPGVVMTRELEAAMAAQYQANGFTPLTKAQVLALLPAAASDANAATSTPPFNNPKPVYTGAPPAYPAGLPRFQDSNPSSFDDWSVETERDLPSL